MFTRKLTVINGKTEPDDWMILKHGIPVGRVYDARISTGGGRWVWAVQVGRVGMGHAETFDAALEAVRERAG
jgi:hypothetical protein